MRRSGQTNVCFSTDFPHESFDARHCRRQIDELLARDDVNQVDKEASGSQRQTFLRHCLETGETFWPNRLHGLNDLKNLALHGSHHDHRP